MFIILFTRALNFLSIGKFLKLIEDKNIKKSFIPYLTGYNI
jgi:hypothetical protein